MFHLVIIYFSNIIFWEEYNFKALSIRIGLVRGVHKVLVGKTAGKRPMGRPRRRWEDNIKMDLQEVRVACGDWME